MPWKSDDHYRWEVVFRDGNRLREDDDERCTRHPSFPDGHDGMPHAFACIDAEVASIALNPIGRLGVSYLDRIRGASPSLQFPPVLLMLPVGAKPIMFRRRGEHHNLTTGEQAESNIQVIGYALNGRGRSYKTMLCVLEDGRVFVAPSDELMQPSAPASWEHK